MTFLQNVGLSHSEISGSKVICTYPELIAAYHVLHRLREPRHPPCALAYFLSNLLSSIRYQVSGIKPEYSISRYLKRTVRYILLALTKILLSVPSCQRSFSFSKEEWRITDSNRWPSACKADALASWANPPRVIEHRNNVLATTIFVRSSPRQSWTADLYIISVAL